MDNPKLRDLILIEEENGDEREYAVEALFDLEDDSFALLTSEEEVLLMRIEEEDGEQFLIGLDDHEEAENILHAYQVAIESAPAE
ncbi:MULTISPECIES: DUF1292 domain-containing protein [unclassified Bacillus (in: firmicutes)]|uniref:DUF1292 domain-containing protein n=1 Tax=unclassified Bacillus (in: firmicutes) TaxID=185979 RepID=UPI000E3B6530|nr:MULTISPECIES: DUF1292 domain-containing protein [unclassified Bacillus (in: firmicutes)]RFU62752.1 DUF1292 domain-containing protein [Bacillus sp. V59.32b]CAH0346399.1 hypothetical protein BCI9360_02733 [Bacillus sp. CECT 9360]